MTDFAPGAIVRVLENFPVGHIRTPTYIRGKTGEVVRRFGRFANPELLAYRQSGPERTLYEVRFLQKDLWPDYEGSSRDTVLIDVYEHWLEQAKAQDTAA